MIAAYATVLLAELAGDKSLYTIGSLTLRYRWEPIFAGISAAFAAKTLVAVMFGSTLARIPMAWLAPINATALFATAAMLWCRHERLVMATRAAASWISDSSVSFAAVFFTEWIDLGQITTALIAAQYAHPIATWLGATAAMVTKGALALALGLNLRRFLPASTARMLAAGSCVLLGVATLLQGMLP